MGGSSQPKNTTTTTQVNLPPWLSNAYQNYFNQTQDVNNKPYQQYGGQTVAAPTDQQNNATWLAQMGANGQNYSQQLQMNALQNIASGQYNVNPGSNQYLGQTTNVGTNQYAGQNPYLGQMVNQAQQNIVNSYNKNDAPALAAQFASNGAFGGSAYNDAMQQSQNTLAQNLGNVATSLYGQDYQNQQQLAENALNRSVSAQQTDLARNAGLAQQDIANRLGAAQQNAGLILNAGQGITGANALQSQFLGQYGNLATGQQNYQQALLDQQANNWYNKNYGYDQQRLANMGQALNSVQGAFQGQTQTGLNPMYKGRSLGGAISSGAGGAAAGGAIGSMIAGGAAGSVAPGWGTAIGAGVGLLGYYL